MVQTSKLCALVVMASLIVPLIVGFVLPAGSNEETSYETSNRANVTDDLSTTNEPYYADYVGERNLYGWLPALTDPGFSIDQLRMTANWNEISNKVSSYAETTLGSPSTIQINKPGGSGYPWTVPFDPSSKVPQGTQFAVRFDGELFSSGIESPFLDAEGNTYFAVVYYVETGRTVAYAENNESAQYTVDMTGQTIYLNGEDGDYVRIYARQLNKTGEFVNGFEGVKLQWMANAQYWSNGLDNSQVDLLLRFDGTLGTSYDVNVNFVLDGQTYSVGIDRDGATGRIMVSGGGKTQPLGGGLNNVFKYILISFDAEKEHTISVVGLTGMNSFASDYEIRKANTVIVHENVTNKDVLYLSAVADDYTGIVSAFVSRTLSVMGEHPVIRDSSITMDDYWPNMNAMLFIPSVAVYGTSITIQGTTYPVTNGKITVNETEIPIIGLQIYRLGDGMYINGIKVLEDYRNGTITFDGTWLFQGYLYQVVEVTQNVYYWNWGSFAFTFQEFCVMGLVTALFSVIVAGLYGKRSGAKVLSLMITAGCVALIYLSLLVV